MLAIITIFCCVLAIIKPTKSQIKAKKKNMRDEYNTKMKNTVLICGNDFFNNFGDFLCYLYHIEGNKYCII